MIGGLPFLLEYYCPVVTGNFGGYPDAGNARADNNYIDLDLVSHFSVGVAGVAVSANLDGRLGGVEAGFPGPRTKALLNHRIGEFRDLAAIRAYGESDQTVVVTMIMAIVAMRACYKGIQAFQPVHPAGRLKLVQRAIDLQRRTEPLIAQLVEQRIGA
jgi:hypothetical protein